MKQKAIDTIVAQGILPLYFNADEQVSINIVRALYQAGIKAVEYTNRGETALHNFKNLVVVRNTELPGLLLGVGTIKNIHQAHDYITAGADFIVSPGYLKEVADKTNSINMLYVPGCMTPTEIMVAENDGLTFIKLFPGNILGVDFLKSIKEIFPKLLFMPTGGVDTTKESIYRWFNAGAAAVGIGGQLITKELMATQDCSTIRSATKDVLTLIQSIKK
ncbi:MAG: hypothetical protein QM528_04990 [Phycisphaerales bacterium]|nr:hypothetical protein [Phycisphaerales bacterium]